MTEEVLQLVAVMAGVSGEDFNTILSGGRRRPLPVCRYLIARELHNRGYSYNHLSKELGMNHATVMYGIRLLGNMKHGGYANELRIERLFLQAIKRQES